MEYNLTKVDEGLSQAFAQIAQSETKLKEQMVEESRKREAAHKELEKSLQDSMVGNYATLAFGAFWVVVGVVISALAPEVAKAVAGHWVVAWKAM